MANEYDFLDEQGFPVLVQNLPNASQMGDLDLIEAKVRQEEAKKAQAAAAAQPKPVNRQPAQAQPQMQVQPGGSPNDLLKQLLAAREHERQINEQGIQEQRDQLKTFLAQGDRPDLSAVFNWIDAGAGTNYSQGYKRPMTPEERAQAAAKLQNAINERQAAVSKQDADTLKSALMAKAQEGKEDARDRRFAQMLGLRKEGLDIRKEGQAWQVSQGVEKHPIIVDIDTRLNQLGRDKTLLDQGGPVPAQMADELAQGVANALAGRGGAGFHAFDTQRFKSLFRTAQEFKSFIKGTPLNAMTKDQRDFLMHTIDRLEIGYQRNREAQVKKLLSDAKFRNNPAAQAVVDSKLARASSPAESSSPAGISLDAIEAELKRRGH